MDILNEVLELEAKKNEKYKSTDVEKNLELEFDLKNLVASDLNEFENKILQGRGDNKEEWLKNITRDNTQLLLNSIWSLPIERVENDVFATLPEKQIISIPRAKRCPKPKPLTKWQKYAVEKGIKKKKKTNVVWDDILQKWIPRFGYRKADAEKQKDWILEVPQNADPLEDQFAKKHEKKKEKVAKNEFQRLRNLASAKKIKIPKEGLPPVDSPSVQQLSTAAGIARSSTASLGRFQPKISKERANAAFKDPLNKKKKFDHTVVSGDKERTNMLAVADKLLNKRPILDIEKAVNLHINEEQQQRSKEKKGKAGKPKGGKKRTQHTAAKGGKVGKKRAVVGKKAKGGRKRR